MAGTQLTVEGLPSYRVTNLLAATTTPQNSLEGGFDISTLTDRATCWVESANGTYQWDQDSTAAANGTTIIIPLGQAGGTPGRWFLLNVAVVAGSFAVGEAKMTGNATGTIAEDAFFPVLGTFTVGLNTNFTISAAGVITYTGAATRDFQISVALAVKLPGATLITFQMFHTPISTGTPVAIGTPFTVIMEAAAASSVALLATIAGLKKNDILQLRLSVAGDDAPCTVVDAEILVTAIPIGSV